MASKIEGRTRFHNPSLSLCVRFMFYVCVCWSNSRSSTVVVVGLRVDEQSCVRLAYYNPDVFRAASSVVHSSPGLVQT